MLQRGAHLGIRVCRRRRSRLTLPCVRARARVRAPVCVRAVMVLMQLWALCSYEPSAVMVVRELWSVKHISCDSLYAVLIH